MNLKIVLAFLITAIILPISCFAENNEWKKRITPEIALKAIELFQKNPLDKNADGALSIIINFADISDDVIITLDPMLLPWTKSNIKYSHSHTLFGAFVAGNLKKQILQRERKDHPYDGVVQIIATYKQLRNKNAVKKIKEIEKWIEIQNSGKLKSYIKILTAKKTDI